MILKTLEIFKKIIPTAISIDHFEDVEPYIEDAENWIRVNILGTDLYDVIDSIPDNDSKLRSLCQNVIANQAYHEAIPFLDLIHTNQGFGVIQSNNLVPASKDRVSALRKQCIVRRDYNSELLFDYLEANDHYHDQWKESSAFSVFYDCLITTAVELSVFAKWEGTRKDFLHLRPELIQHTCSFLERIFSKNYIDELIKKRRMGMLTESDMKVSFMLKQCLGSLVTDNKIAAKSAASDALRYIDAYESDFPTYYASSEYRARIDPGFQNAKDEPVFSSLFD